MGNREVQNINNEPGLLPHEAKFVLGALEKAQAANAAAAKEYGDAVANSGGDWAFDDGASAASAELAHQRALQLRTLENLGHIARHVAPLPYPEPESTAAQIGSRVTAKIGRFTDQFDITSRYIPGLEAPEDVELLSPASPMGKAFLGAEPNTTVQWSADDGRTISAEILGIDQMAQTNSYQL